MKRIKQMGIVLGLMIVMTAVLMGIAGFVLWKCQSGDWGIGISVVIIDIAVNLSGGFGLGKMIGKQKLVWGLCLGTTYFLLLVLIGIGFFDTRLQGNSLVLSGFFMCAISGMVGGMLAPEKKNVTKN